MVIADPHQAAQDHRRRFRGILAAVGHVAVVTITIHVLEIVGLVIVLLLYLLFKVWRRI
jgi:hypothetical protein